MTTPPKVRKFHASADESVRSGLATAQNTPQPQSRVEVHKRAEQAEPSAATDNELRERMMQPESHNDGFGDFRLTDQPTEQSENPADPELAKKIEAIKAENLSPRQLRIAGRIAALHQIEVNSDEEAVLQLRERGIDPSHRAALSKILTSAADKSQAEPGANTPALRAPNQPPAIAKPAQLPSRESMTEENRAAEILRIQKDLAKRRRRRMFMLAMRLLVFVALPTIAAGWYYFSVATPLYGTVSQFQVQIATGPESAATGSALGMSPLGAVTDAIAVQGYLTSREAMLRLDEEVGFKEAYQGPSIDPLTRLPPDASNEDTYDLYRESIKISFDPTAGVVDMETIAPSPELSEKFSRKLLEFAEQQVDQMTSRLRDDQMKGAAQNYENAEENVLAAQRHVQELQEQLGVLDPQAENQVIMSQIATLEAEISKKKLELGQLLANSNPVQSRVNATRGDIRRLEEMVQNTRVGLTEGSKDTNSLAKISGELRIAESNLQTRQTLLASAAEQMEAAQIEANKQVRYLSLSIPPVPPDEATYPNAFQNTLVALLIFSGIYLLLSLTASILREQVSS